MSKFLVTKKYYGDLNAKFIVGKQVLEIDDINKKRFSTIKKHFKTFIDIVFDSCGGNNIESIKLALGDTFSDLPTPTKSQHIFLGWFTSASGGTQITSETLVGLDISTLYAQWEKIQIDPNNCTSYSVTTTSSYKNTGIYTASILDSSQPIYIDWGDGTVEKLTSSISQKSHTYKTVGNFTVKINNNITSFAPSYSNSTWCGTTSQNRYTFKGMLTTGSNVTSLPTYAFYYCQAMTNIDFMETCWSTVISLPNYCFYYCSGLISIQGAKRFTSLGSYCFQYCSGLTGVQDLSEFKFTTLHNSYTFANCTNVTQWILPDGFTGTSFASYMFSNNNSLVSVGNIEKTINLIEAVQIEYLAGNDNRTAWLNTNYYPNQIDEINTSISYNSNASSGWFFCTQDSHKENLSPNTSGPSFGYGWSNDPFRFVYGGGYSPGATRFEENKIVNINIKNGILKIDDDSIIIDRSQSTLTSPSWLPLFANNRTSASSIIEIANSGYKIYNFQVIRETNVILDLIPVRIGNVGYMYDKVSRRLFENNGTGNFVLGPDKTDVEKIMVEQESITSKLPESLTSTGTYVFQNCSNLKNITIPSKVQSIGNYAFYGCTSLNNIDIEATSLTAINHYAFYNCNKLTNLDLPDTIKTIGNYAFYGCTSLNYAGQKVRISDIPAIPTIPYNNTYLCFTAEKAGSTIKMAKNTSSAPTVYLETSPTSEEGSWTEFFVHTSSTSTDGTTITLADVGDKVYFRAKQDNLRFATSESNYNKFVMTGKIAASGNLNTLLKADGSVLDLTGRDYCYSNMFYYCTSLTQAPELLATTLATYCYYRMFYYCTSLTQAPELPATTLATYCYRSMFTDCTSLTQAPELPVLYLVDYCYYQMFQDCTSLTQAPELPATTLANQCYSYMFYGCTKLNNINVNFSTWNPTTATNSWVTKIASTGTFACPTELPKEFGAARIPTGWTITTTNIPTRIEYHFPSQLTSIGANAYQGCSNLKSLNIPENLQTIGDYAFAGCYQISSIVDKRLTAQTVSTNTFGNTTGTGTNAYTGYQTKGSNTILTYFAATGYDENTWDDPLQNSDKCGFIQQYIDPENVIYYTVTFDAGIGEISETTKQTVKDKKIGELPEPICPEDMPYFGGWYTAANGEGDKITKDYIVTSDITLYALYGAIPFTSYEVILNNQWQASTIVNPNSNQYDGVYESFSNYNVGSKASVMYIKISGYTSFTIYIRSNAESSYDYTIAFNLDTYTPSKPLTSNPSSSTSGVKAHTSGKQNSGTAIGSYTKVEYTGIDGGEHYICVAYRKDSSVNDGSDRGYVLIEQPPKPITINFDLNGGILNSGSLIVTSYQGNTFDTSYCPDVSGPSSKPFFIGWNDKADGSGTTYNNSTILSNQSYITLYAQYITENPVDINKDIYLCFTAEEAGSTIEMTTNGSAPIVYLETSTTGNTFGWTEFTVDSTTITLPNVGDKVYFRAKQDNERFGTGVFDYNYFIMTGKIAASGNLNTLLKADGSVLELTGRDYCYSYMFYNCESLTQAPELPATTLANECYSYMFQNCTALTQAPELPATTLANYCYSSMFHRCTSLQQAPELSATNLAWGCYICMFYECTSLTQAPELPATTLAEDCYQSMFNRCTSLTQAPELPATTLAYMCYCNMFNGCTKLNSININFSNWDLIIATDNWVSNVASSGTFTCPTALSETYGTSYIPSGWTVVRK